MKLALRGALCACLLGAPIACSLPALAETNVQSKLPDLQISEFKLDNGLTVLLSRDSSLPQVTVEIRFLVGSANEAPGLEGFAHLFEHLMFQGSEHFNQDYFAPYEAIGGSVNGTTSFDRTNYFEQLPSSHLELALWMESDRVQTLLNVLTEERFENQRSVVLNERRQRYVDAPYGMASTRIFENLFPEGHPYHHPTIGYPEPLNAAKLADAQHFFKTFYSPSNAVLAIAGDFDPKTAKELVELYFGNWKKTETPERPKAETPVLAAGLHVTEQDEVSLPQVNLAWISPAVYTEGDAALDLWATILGDGKNSRLYKDLVYDQKLLQDLEVYQYSSRIQSMFIISATAAPGHSIDEIATALDRSLEKALSTPPTEEEVIRAKNQYRKAFFRQSEGLLNRVHRMTQYWHCTGQADYAEADLARYEQMNSEKLFKAADLLKANRLRVDIIPTEGGQK